MNMKVNISISKRDIECGKRRDPQCCPAAIAVAEALRAMGSPCSCVAVYYYVYVVLNGNVMWADLPIDLALFVDRFDNGFSVVPEKFRLMFKEV